MYFNSIPFIFYFLPVVLLGYALLSFSSYRRVHIIFLILASILFYFWSVGFSCIVLIITATSCYGLQKLFSHKYTYRKMALTGGICALLLLLAYYKYNPDLIKIPFIAHQLESIDIFRMFAKPHALLLGVSFFTFQGISYLIEAYRSRRQFPLLDSLLYFVFFPKLLQGPITRFSEIRRTLRYPVLTYEGFFEGWVRFCMGLGKKVILADSIGTVANAVFMLNTSHLSKGTALLGIISYTLQIFLDFSGYTDMAIGVARMLGVTLPENFLSPYTSNSVTEFWNRWHITLSRWLRDYVYIPLGGNRKGKMRTITHIMIVFILSGLWHGTGMQYLFWGMYHGFWISLEKVVQKRLLYVPDIIMVPWTFIVISIGWVFFRSPTLPYAFRYLMSLFSNGSIFPLSSELQALYNNRLLFCYIVGCCVVFGEKKIKSIAGHSVPNIMFRGVSALIVFIYAVSLLATASFSPFLYFRY